MQENHKPQNDKNEMQPDKNQPEVVEGNIEPNATPLKEESPPNLQIYQQIAHYTDHPERLLQVLEDNDEGFIQRLNNITLNDLEKDKHDRQLFAKRQAYISLFIGGVSALSILGLAFYMVYKGSVGFLPFLGLGVFYAITQSVNQGLMAWEQSLTLLLKRY